MVKQFIYISLLCAVLIHEGYAQELEPRRWSHLPVDSNFIGIGYLHTQGDIYLDPTLKVEDAKVEVNGIIASYLRSFDLAGKSARLDLLVPLQKARWEGLLDGVPAVVEREGAGDPRVRLSINLLGAPALKGSEFKKYRVTHSTNTVAGAAISIRLPLGQYYSNKLLNLGSNRFVIRPQIGIVHTRGPWSFELSGSVFFYTDNNDFWNGSRREQEPLYAAQAHLIYTFKPGLWASLSSGYDYGGQSIVDSTDKDDTRSDFLYALSAGYPLSRTTGIKVAYARGRTREDVGSDTDNIVLAISKMY